MKRPLQLVTIPVQETEVWKDDTYRHSYNLQFVCVNGFQPDKILQDISTCTAWQDKTYPPPEDPGDRLFGNYMIGRSFKFFKPKVSTFKDRLSDYSMKKVRILGFIDL